MYCSDADKDTIIIIKLRKFESMASFYPALPFSLILYLNNRFMYRI